jgi:hypothetical protein
MDASGGHAVKWRGAMRRRLERQDLRPGRQHGQHVPDLRHREQHVDHRTIATGLQRRLRLCCCCRQRQGVRHRRKLWAADGTLDLRHRDQHVVHGNVRTEHCLPQRLQHRWAVHVRRGRVRELTIRACFRVVDSAGPGSAFRSPGQHLGDDAPEPEHWRMGLRSRMDPGACRLRACVRRYEALRDGW